MAKAKTKAKSPGGAPKKGPAAKKPTRAGAKPDAKKLKAGKKSSSKSKGKGFEALGRLADHPLIGDLLAVGAMAAVAVIAEKGFSGKTKGKTGGSSQAVRAAGKAAAAAIGKRLLDEVGEIKKASKPS